MPRTRYARIAGGLGPAVLPSLGMRSARLGPALGICVFLAATAAACKKTPPEVKRESSAKGAAKADGTELDTHERASEAPASGQQAEDLDTKPPAGVDDSAFDDFERKVYYRIVNREASVCGKAESLIASAKTDPSCEASRHAARYVARLVRTGYTDSEIEEALESRYRDPVVHDIDVRGAPVKGNPKAPVTIVEFVDYECPHCAQLQPVLRQIMEEFGNDVRLVMKHYPLGQHTNARMAARAAVAAQKQDKFWAYHDRIWPNSDFLTKAKLEEIAEEVGLDKSAFIAAMASPESEARVQADRSQGQDLGVASTPTVFINGKLFTDSRDVESLRDWVSEALGR